jgi:hypothetical protein
MRKQSRSHNDGDHGHDEYPVLLKTLSDPDLIVKSIRWQPDDDENPIAMQHETSVHPPFQGDIQSI